MSPDQQEWLARLNQLEQALARVNEQFKPRQPNGQDLVRNVSVMYGENPESF